MSRVWPQVMLAHEWSPTISSGK